MEIWEQLLSTAILGTERQSPALPAQTGALGAMLDKLKDRDPEHLLLGAAAAVTLFRRAGFTAPTDSEPLPKPCADDPRPECTARQRDLLALVLGSKDSKLLEEWLTYAVAANRCLPDELLPALCAAKHWQEAPVPAIGMALGPRGQWLTRQNAKWTDLLQESPAADADWETALPAQRVAILTGIRANDPARARAMLEADWSQFAPKERAALLATFATGLSMVDEPFLEAALDDKRKEVREVAISLLPRLPDSRLSQRNLARLLPLFNFTPAQPMRLLPPTPARPARLEVTLPEVYDKVMQRDGIEEKAPTYLHFSDKAWQLRQMINLVPPDFWCTRWGTTPEELLELCTDNSWANALRSGWTKATLLHRNPAWAIQILAWKQRNEKVDLDINGLGALLPAAYCEEEVLALLKRENVDKAMLSVYSLLERCQRPWSPALAHAVLAWIRQFTARKTTFERPYWAADIALLDHCLSAYAYSVHPTSFGDIFTILQAARQAFPDVQYHDHWEKQFISAEAKMLLRRDMFEAFQG